MESAAFQWHVVATFPYAIHTVVTDNCMALVDLSKNRNGSSRRYLGMHIFEWVCQEHVFEHQLTKPYHP